MECPSTLSPFGLDYWSKVVEVFESLNPVVIAEYMLESLSERYCTSILKELGVILGRSDSRV
jgi:hypothetical protein